MKDIHKFDSWNMLKKNLHQKDVSHIYFKEGDIWWSFLGQNIRTESYGKGPNFRRPVLIFKKLSSDSFLAIPLSTKIKQGTWFCEIDLQGFKRTALLYQIKMMHKNRLGNKLGQLDEKDFTHVKKDGVNYSIFHKFVIPHYVGIDGKSPKSKSIISILYKKANFITIFCKFSQYYFFISIIMKKAIAYLRKSTDRKDKQRFSLETQQKEIKKAQQVAEAFFDDEVCIVDTFVESISGTSRERPEFDKMLTKFDTQEAEILLSWRLDRLSRNPTDSGAIMQAMQDRIIPYVADATRVYTRKDSGLLMGVLFGQASQESMEIADKSMVGMRTLIENGGVPYKVPFGAKNNKDTTAPLSERVIIDPIESKFAEKMFEMRANGSSFSDIAKYLGKNGFKNKNGKLYSNSTIQNWISNTFYYGVCRWGEYVWNHIYQPIIDKEIWEKANAVGRGNIPRLHDDAFPLKGMIKSAISGRPLTASLAKGKYPQYHSHGNHKKEGDNVSISEKEILKDFEERIPFYIVPKSLKPLIKRTLKRVHKEQFDIFTRQRRQLSHDITKLTNKMDSLVDFRIEGELSAEEFMKRKKEYSSQIADMSATLHQVILQDDTYLDMISNCVEVLNNLGEYWKSSDNKTKLQIIKLICVELVVTPEKALIIQENAVFEGLRKLNCTEWLPGLDSNQGPTG